MGADQKSDKGEVMKYNETPTYEELKIREESADIACAWCDEYNWCRMTNQTCPQREAIMKGDREAIK